MRGTNRPAAHFLLRGRHQRSNRRLSWITEGDGFIFKAQINGAARRAFHVGTETLQPTFHPGLAERAIDTATDVSSTITEVSAALQAAVDRLSEIIATARQPGKPLATISAITREAPLASLSIAFLFGVAIARRR